MHIMQTDTGRAVVCDVVAWTLYGIIGSQLGDVQDVITVEGQQITVQQYLEDTYGFAQSGLWYTVIILLGFSITFWFVVAGEASPIFLCDKWVFQDRCSLNVHRTSHVPSHLSLVDRGFLVYSRDLYRCLS